MIIQLLFQQYFYYFVIDLLVNYGKFIVELSGQSPWESHIHYSIKSTFRVLCVHCNTTLTMYDKTMLKREVIEVESWHNRHIKGLFYEIYCYKLRSYPL